MSLWKRWFGKKGAASDAPISGEAGGQTKGGDAEMPAAEGHEARSPAPAPKEPAPGNPPIHRSSTDTREIRVFVSSTFRDMIQERDLLVKHVFPQLRRECAKRQVTFTEVDLRWGITEAESSEGKVLPLCLAEIERCRPYFIGLLGERYGWVPETIADELIQEQPWLKNHLHDSVTELEILHGVLKSPLMRDRSLFYFRSPGYINQVPVENRADFLEENQDLTTRLSRLKQRLRDEHTRGHLRFAPRENYPDPESLGQMILADFTQLIDELYPLDQVPDPLDQEAMRHEAYGRSRRLAFVGRQDLLQQLTEHVASGGSPLVVTGESGCGKSALLTQWVAGWRQKHPDDLVIEHYIGSTPDSADWQGLVRRILSELKRAYDIADELPMQADALRTALNDWLVKAAGQRRIVLVLDALNQLTDADAAHQLGWLPVVFPPNVRVLVSTLAGETRQVLQQRQWPGLPVPLFGQKEIAPAAEAYFKLFAKTPDERMLKALESAPAAANPLYLRAVLDELRQYGHYEKLPQQTAWYLAAPDLPSLFDRILSRWNDDFGKDPRHPDLVRRSLCLMACSRFGLAERELLDLLGSRNGQGQPEPLPQRPWAPLYLAAESALAIRGGLLNFGHDYLRTAVLRRWLTDEKIMTGFRIQLADYFATIPETNDRKLDELPALLRDTGQWEKLKDLLADLSVFLSLRSTERWRWELIGYWIPLREHFDPGDVYRRSLADREAAGIAEEELAYLMNITATFHLDAGDYATAEPLFCLALEGSERVLGKDHPSTLTSANNLAALLHSKGDYGAAEPLFRLALEGYERVLGKDHPYTLNSAGRLGLLLHSKGDHAAAEPFLRRALEGSERVLNKDHPDTLTSASSLGVLLESKGDYGAAEPLYRLALEGRERVLGKDHPYTLNSACSLGVLLHRKGDHAAAEPFLRRALEGSERVLGKDHPSTLNSASRLGRLLLHRKGDHAAAEPLYRRALEGRERVLGKDHSNTLDSVNNLAALLHSKGDYAAAEPLLRRALEGKERVLGKDHPDTLQSANNLGVLLDSKGDYGAAEPLYRRALEGRERVLGKDHPDTLSSVNNLGVLLGSKGDYGAAEPLYRRALEGRERVLGKDHPDTLSSVNNLGALLDSKGDYATAEPLYRRAQEGRERVLGKDHPDTLQSVNNLGALLDSKGDYATAEPLYRRALEGRERVLGKDHPVTLQSANNLGVLLYSNGDYATAEPLYRRALEGQERVLGKDHPHTLLSANNLAVLLDNKGDHAAAEPLYRRALEGRQRVLGKDHPDTLLSVNKLRELLCEKGDYAEAESLFRQELKARERMGQAEQPDFALSLNRYALILRRIGRFDEAAGLLRQAIAIEKRTLPPEHPKHAHRKNNLANVLMLAGQLDEAAKANAEAWKLKTYTSQGGHDLTSARILFTRISLHWLNGSDPSICIGQLRTLLEIAELPCLGGVDVVWDASDIIASLQPKLSSEQMELMTSLVESMNDRKRMSNLDRFAIWRFQPGVSLEKHWQSLRKS